MRQTTLKGTALCLLTAVGISGSSFSQTIVAGWNMHGLTNHGPATLAPTTTAPGVTVGPLTRGPGVLTYAPNFSNPLGGWGGHGFDYLAPQFSLNNGRYFTFTITVNPGYVLSIDSIKPFAFRRVSTGPTNAVVQYQIDSGSFVDIDTVNFNGQLGSGSVLPNIDLSSIAQLQQLEPEQVVTFRIVPWGASETVGLIQIYDVGNSNALDFAVQGRLEANSLATDYFRTRNSGNWTDTSTWESSADNQNWHHATLVPDSTAAGVWVRAGHTLSLDSTVVIDQLSVESGGLLSVGAGDTLRIADGAGADIVVDGSVTIAAGGSLILLSNENGTATIGASAGTISGDVTVERYIPAKRAWRFVTAPVNTSTTIFDNWQEGGLTTLSGYGTHIMGPVGATNGIDAGANAYSMFRYETAATPNTWAAVTSTNQTVDTFSVGTGYRMFIRGDRTVPVSSSNNSANATTLRATGSVLMGDVVFAGGNAPASHSFLPALDPTPGEFSLVGNPFASSIDIDAVMANNSPGAATAGINTNYYWAWDAQLAGSNNRGRYVVYDLGLQENNGSASEVSQHIQSGQAFFVQTIANDPTLAIVETNKSDGKAGIFKTTTALPKLTVTMMLDDSITVDESYVKFGTAFSDTTGVEDAAKLTNADENLAIFRHGRSLSIEARPEVVSADTIPLNIWQLENNGNYSFTIEAADFPATWQTYLEDLHLNQLHPLNTTTGTVVNFTSQTSNPASFGSGRFRIIINNVPLSERSVALSARRTEEGVLLNWTISHEENVERFELEASKDAKKFEKIGKVAAAGESAYSFVHNDADKAQVYYKVGVRTRSGEVYYSDVVRLSSSVALPDDLVYPNPVVDRKVNLSLPEKGSYQISVLNSSGKLVFQQEISSSHRQRGYSVELPGNLPAGVYQLNVAGPSKRTSSKIIIQ